VLWYSGWVPGSVQGRKCPQLWPRFQPRACGRRSKADGAGFLHVVRAWRSRCQSSRALPAGCRSVRKGWVWPWWPSCWRQSSGHGAGGLAFALYGFTGRLLLHSLPYNQRHARPSARWSSPPLPRNCPFGNPIHQAGREAQLGGADKG
jgi:hypothetical protein